MSIEVPEYNNPVIDMSVLVPESIENIRHKWYDIVRLAVNNEDLSGEGEVCYYCNLEINEYFTGHIDTSVMYNNVHYVHFIHDACIFSTLNLCHCDICNKYNKYVLLMNSIDTDMVPKSEVISILSMMISEIFVATLLLKNPEEIKKRKRSEDAEALDAEALDAIVPSSISESQINQEEKPIRWIYTELKDCFIQYTFKYIWSMIIKRYILPYVELKLPIPNRIKIIKYCNYNEEDEDEEEEDEDDDESFYISIEYKKIMKLIRRGHSVVNQSS